MNQLNYLRQATKCINEKLQSIANTPPEYARKSKNVLIECAKSKKFLLPEGGRIFDDNLRGLPDVLRLPFPQIVIEYRAGREISVAEQVFGDNTTAVPKRIVYAQEAEDGWIDVVCICGTDHDDWYVLPWFASFRLRDSSDYVVDSDLLWKTNATPIGSVVTQYWLFGELGEQVTDWELRAAADLNDELNTVLSLIEALACSNVSHEALPVRKQNKSGKRRGALPFDEYHILTIAQGSAKWHGDGIGIGRSPREHLRRGHIRRLDNNRRVWVNSCVVNPGSHGKVVSDYKVKA